MDPERWQTIKEVFNRVVDLPIEERSATLREACAGDEALKSEVLELLQYHDHGSLDLPENPHAVTSFVSGLTHEDVIGRQVGGYVIDREIGRGGMGSVYLAHRVDADFEQTVAIKLIKRGFDTDEIIGRFRHERRILAALDHPYITRLLDGGSTEDGRPFLVMEYVEGLPLTEYCDQKRLTVNERLELFLKVCSAVTYAHVNLVIHRDLKPSNILVTPDGIPKLLDFGVAKLLMEPGTGTQRTADMSRAMTPAYASPEQILNNKMTITSDVYSLGVVLYELLAGRKPFNFESMRLDQVARVISQVPPPLPSLTLSRAESAERIASERSTTVERLRRKLCGDLDNIVLSAMKSEPERRYVSSYRLAGDIENYLKGLPVSAQKDSVSYRASKFIQRNKTGVLAGVGIGASIIFALASSARQARRAQRERDRAIREARKSAAINRFAHRMVTSADPTRRGKDVKFIDVIREAEAVLERDFEGQPEPMAELRTAIGLTYLSLGSFDWAEEQLRAALDLRLQIFNRRSAPVADSIRAVAKLLHAKGQLKEAEPLYLEALEILEEVRGSETPKRASVMTDYAHLLALTGRHDEAIAYNREAIRIKKNVFGDDHPEVAISLAETGNVLAMSMSRFEDAEPYHREALRILKLHHKGDHPEVAKALLYLSAAVHERSLADAIAFASESLDMRKRVFGDVHPDVAWACYNVGYFLIKDGRADESLEYSKQVVEMVPKGLPREHTVVNSSYLLLGRGYLLKGAFENALEAFDECLALRKDTLPAGHWLLDTSESFRGYCMAKIGRLEEGLALMRSSHARLAEKLGSDHDQAKEALERLREFESA